MQDKSKEKKLFGKIKIYPFTAPYIISYYIPCIGGTSLCTLGVHVMAPQITDKLFNHTELTVPLLATSMIGSGCYIYTRKHIGLLPIPTKSAFSMYGAVMLNFSSLLLFAVAKSYIKNHTTLGLFSALGCSYIIIKIAKEYFDIMDSKV